MKKVLSFVLMAVFTLQVAAMDVLALGKDEMVWNPDGSKTIFVSTEKLDSYLNKLEQESLTCQANYQDWYVDNPWKGNLAYWASLILPSALFLFLGNKAMKYYNRKTEKPIGPTDSSGNRPNVDVDDKLSSLQKALLGLGTGIVLTYSQLFANKFNKFNKHLECVGIDSRNGGIFRSIEKDPDKPSYHKNIWKFGAMVECPKGDESWCIVNSQKSCYDPSDELYDPELAKGFDPSLLNEEYDCKPSCCDPGCCYDDYFIKVCIGEIK